MVTKIDRSDTVCRSTSHISTTAELEVAEMASMVAEELEAACCHGQNATTTNGFNAACCCAPNFSTTEELDASDSLTMEDFEVAEVTVVAEESEVASC